MANSDRDPGGGPRSAAIGELAATARLAAPLVGGQIAMVAMSFVDTIMAGRLDAASLAAVAVGSSVWASLMLFTLGVLMAVPPSVAQLMGAGRKDRIAPILWQGFWLSQAIAILAILVASFLEPVLWALEIEPEIVPTVAGYLRALRWGVPALCIYLLLRFLNEGMGSSRPTLYFGWLGVGVNVLANYALIYGNFGFPALGAVGCGHATSAVWWAQAAAMVIYMARRSSYRELELLSRFEWPESGRMRQLILIGGPIGVALFIEGSMFSVVALMIGTLGTLEVAGHQVAINFAALTFMVPLGISMAITVRVGFAVGGGDRPGVRRAAFVGLMLALTSQLVSASMMILIPHRVAGIYTDNLEVIEIAVQLLFLAAFFQFSDGVQVSAAGALRGLKDTRVPMVITVVAYWLVGMPLGWWLGFRRDLGARGMWMGLIAGLSLAALLLAIRFLRSTRPMGSWHLPVDLG